MLNIIKNYIRNFLYSYEECGVRAHKYHAEATLSEHLQLLGRLLASVRDIIAFHGKEG
jgi:hypothetical protein